MRNGAANRMGAEQGNRASWPVNPYHIPYSRGMKVRVETPTGHAFHTTIEGDEIVVTFTPLKGGGEE